MSFVQTDDVNVTHHRTVGEGEATHSFRPKQSCGVDAGRATSWQIGRNQGRGHKYRGGARKEQWFCGREVKKTRPKDPGRDYGADKTNDGSHAAEPEPFPDDEAPDVAGGRAQRHPHADLCVALSHKRRDNGIEADCGEPKGGGAKNREQERVEPGMCQRNVEHLTKRHDSHHCDIRVDSLDPVP